MFTEEEKQPHAVTSSLAIKEKVDTAEETVPSRQRGAEAHQPEIAADWWAMGIVEGEQMLLVPHWLIQQLYDPATPGRLRQKGAEDARAYLRTHYGVDGEFTVFWWGTLSQALEYAARSLSSIAKPEKSLVNHSAGK